MKTGRCPDCGKMVRDKPIIGTLHVCLTDEEIAERKRLQRYYSQVIANQQNAQPMPLGLLWDEDGKPMREP